jgi:aminoglycoside 2'-N-acetyltransferase I
VRALLWRAFEDGFSEEDYQHALGGEHVVAYDGSELVCHAAAVPRTLHVGDRRVHTGYVEAVATAPGRRGEQLGSRVMQRLATVIRARYQMGALSTSRHAFYGRLGWQRWLGPSFVIRDGEWVRTPDEDWTPVAPTLRSCARRPGT